MRTFALLTAFLTTSLFAAQYPPEYRWRTIATEHFLIHYHQGEEELARRAGAIAEQAHERVTALFDYAPEGRTHLVITDHVDVSNGSATPYPYNRIEVYVSAPGADPSSPLEHYDDWLNLVITHEYAHIVHLDQANGFWRGVRYALGRNLLTFPNLFSPAWMIEGVATLVESEATEAGRVKGTFIDMVLRTAAIENRFATEPQASGFTEVWPGGNARYYYGSEFLGWLARTRGANKLAEYFHDYAGNVIPMRPNASAKAVYGESLRSLWRAWSDEAQREFRAEGDRIRAAGLTEREVLTTTGYETKYPMLSPDGTRVAYAHRGAYAWPMLRVRDVTTNRDVAEVRVNSVGPLSWCPEGKRIAFAQLEYARTFSLLSDLYVWDVGGDVRRITHGARLKSPAFTSDGAALVAVENKAGRNRLVRVDVASGAVTPIVEPADERQFSEPNVSPDGMRIAVAEWLRGRIDVVVYDLHGTRVANLTEAWPASINASPRFASNDTIWFSSDVTGIANLYTVAMNGTPVRRTNVYGGAFFPTTRDGRTVYYADYSSRGFDLARFTSDATYPVTPRVVPRSVVGREADRAEVTVPTALTNVVDEPYSPRRSLLPRVWSPIFASTASDDDDTEFTVGAWTMGGDALGFHQYQAQVAVTSGENTDTHVDYGLVYSYDRLYPTLTLASSLFTDDTGVRVRSSNQTFELEQRVNRTIAQATFPFTRYRWQTAATIGAVHERYAPDEAFNLSDEQLASVGLFDGALTGARGALAFNTAREFAGSISPESGVFSTLDVEVLRGARDVEQARADVRGYLSLPRGRHVLAARVAGGWSGGDFVLEREMKAGGVVSEGALTFGINEFPVRGFSTGTLRGRRAALASLEYRFPLFDVHRGPATFPLFFHRVLGAIFYDTARVWDSRAFSGGDATISSAGAEVGADLFLGYLAPLRFRVGAALLLDSPRGDSNVELYLGIGRSY